MGTRLRAEAAGRKKTSVKPRRRSLDGWFRPLSHELGNLLAAIRLAGHLLAGHLPARDRALLSVEVERLSAHAAALLSLTRLLRKPGDLVAVSPRELLAALRRSVSDCVPEGVKLTIVAGRGCPDLSADPDAVHHLLQATVLSAIGAVGDGGRVRVSVGAQGRRVRFSVVDDGPRLVPADLGSRTPRGRALVADLVDTVLRNCGGRLELGKPRRGAHLDLWMPAARARRS